MSLVLCGTTVGKTSRWFYTQTCHHLQLETANIQQMKPWKRTGLRDLALKRPSSTKKEVLVSIIKKGG